MDTTPLHYLRSGRSRDTNLYIQIGPTPASTDPQVGMITDPQVMEQILAAHGAPTPLPAFTAAFTLLPGPDIDPFNTLPDVGRVLQGMPWDVVEVDAYRSSEEGGGVDLAVTLQADQDTSCAQVMAEMARALTPFTYSSLSITRSSPRRPS